MPIPKVLTAIAVWRQQPTAIEAELADRGHDITDWHRGRMSSRQLLALLRWPRHNGPYATALLGGEFPLWMQMIREIHKELALDRASKYVGTDYAYEPKTFVSAAESAEREAEEEAETQFQEREFGGLMSRIFGGSDDEPCDE